jgi:hypothetical protein
MATNDVDEYVFQKYSANCSIPVSSCRAHAPVLERASQDVLECVERSDVFTINDYLTRNASIIKRAHIAAFDRKSREREVPRLAFYADNFTLALTPFLAAFAIELFRYYRGLINTFMSPRIHDAYCHLTNVTFSIVFCSGDEVEPHE